MRKVGNTSRGDRNKIPVANDNSGNTRGRRCSRRNDTGIRSDVTGSPGIKIPVMMCGLLELHRLELSGQSLLIPACVGGDALGRPIHRSGRRDTPLAGPLTGQERLLLLVKSRGWWTGCQGSLGTGPHVGARPRILV